MSAATDTAGSAVPLRPGSAIGQSVRDSLVVAKRNLIRMARIPHPVRSYQSGFISPRIRNLDLSGLEINARGVRLPVLDGRKGQSK
ncbi:hypothetical protein [Streptomyces griseoaurantiacus]|uniref:hypothetical protein n=1 Tax=Streptomyces griseoaurantiacus TaxID=68213 RepID=UPI00386C9201